MKVMYVLSYLSLRYGGPPSSVRTLTEAMISLGLDAHCWGTGENTDRNELELLGPPFRSFPTRWPRNWYRSPELASALEIETPSFDLLHLNEIWTHPLYAAASSFRKNRKPYLITPRGIFTQSWRYNTPKKRLYLRLVGNKMIAGAACLHALTQAEVGGFREAGYHGPATIVPNGIDPGKFAHMPDPDAVEKRCPELRGKRVVHFLSRLSPEKGLDQLIPAWADTVRGRSYNDCILVISGPNHQGYRSVVEGLIKLHDLGKSVLLTGMVTGSEKLALISRSDVYVLPSYSEGFSVSVLEHLAAGKPVLVTSGCNFPEVLDAGAGLCVRPQRDALAQALRRLLDMTDSERKQMGLKGRELVTNNYTWEIAARKLITVYDCILHGKEIPLHPNPIELDSAGKAVLR